MGKFFVEFVRLGQGHEVLATLRDGPTPDLGCRLVDAAGVVWKVLGHTSSEVRLLAEASSPEGLLPKGPSMKLTRATASPFFLPERPPLRYAHG